jgi:lysozyme
MMVLGPKGRALIQSFEGLRLQAYQDGGGIWTIGYGHIRGVVPYLTCTESEAQEWFTQDVASAVSAVIRSLDIAVSQCQFDALVAFTFNVGATAEGHSTLLQCVNNSDFDAAADEFLKWNHIKGVVSAGLTRRREAERTLFLDTST